MDEALLAQIFLITVHGVACLNLVLLAILVSIRN